MVPPIDRNGTHQPGSHADDGDEEEGEVDVHTAVSKATQRKGPEKARELSVSSSADDDAAGLTGGALGPHHSELPADLRWGRALYAAIHHPLS